MDACAMTMEEIYSEKFWELFADLDVSAGPAGPDELYELAAPYLAPGHRILDVGCRDARHLVELVRRCAGTGTGLDPVPWHVRRARSAVDAAGLAGQIKIRLGVAEDLTEETAGFDLVWCRDVVEVLPDLPAALAEMHRVMKPEGHLVIYTNVLRGPVDPRENAAVHEPLGNVVANLVEPDLEAALAAAGFRTEVRYEVGTRWREHLEEHHQSVSRDLLRLARLRRDADRFVARYGQAAYRTAEASLQWDVHQFLGRFVPVVYVLASTTPSGGEGLMAGSTPPSGG
jgi:SAM-dependent methyltransferase